jgi:hypothetical protein
MTDPWDTFGHRSWSSGDGKNVEHGPEEIDVADIGGGIRFLLCVPNDLTNMNKRCDFPHLLQEMVIQLERFYVGEELRPEDVRAARSAFLIECMAVLEKRRTWSKQNLI